MKAVSPQRFLRSRQGGVAVTAALTGGLLCMLAAAGADLGVLALHARKLQGAADLAALSAASNLERAETAAQETARMNMGDAVTVRTERGVYRSDRSLAPDRRFSSAGDDANAARVTLVAPARMFFGRWLLGRETVEVRRQATAALPGTPRAAFSLGSRLARLDGGLANQLLSMLTGSEVQLTALDYQALADLDVNLLGFVDALETELDLTVGDHDALLDRRIDAGSALKVLENVVGDDDAGALDKLVRATSGLDLDLGDLIGVDAGAPAGLDGALDVDVSALDLATAMLEVAGGERQAALDLGARAGLADLKVSLAIGERPNRSPWLAVSASGEPIIRTAQARLYLRARTAGKLSGLAQVNLPILVEVAAAEARLKTLFCRPGQSVVVEARPGVARAWIGTIDEARLSDFKSALKPQKATLLSVLGLATIRGRADIEAADTAYSPLTFSAEDIETARVRSVSSRAFTSGLVSSLLTRLELDVSAVGLDLGLGDVTRGLGVLLAPLGPVLDGVVATVLDLLGLRLGEADVRVHGLSCPQGRGTPRLVG